MGVLAGFHHGSSNHPTRAGQPGSVRHTDDENATIIGRAREH